MVPRIAKRGYSFKGSGLYYLHDKEAMTSERVAWTQTRNVLTDNPELALKVMAWTDVNSDYLKERSGGSSAGAKQTKGNVYNTSLAWHPDEKPDKEAMIKAADEYIAHMGLSGHEAVIVAHNDTDHAHLHIILNLVHPETGKVKDPGLDQPRAQKWALEYERRTGKIYCPVREENAQRREQGEKIKHRAQKQGYSEAVTRAYRAADNGKAFARSLKEEGLTIKRAAFRNWRRNWTLTKKARPRRRRRSIKSWLIWTALPCPMLTSWPLGIGPSKKNRGRSRKRQRLVIRPRRQQGPSMKRSRRVSRFWNGGKSSASAWKKRSASNDSAWKGGSNGSDRTKRLQSVSVGTFTSNRTARAKPRCKPSWNGAVYGGFCFVCVMANRREKI